ncbi:MAG: peptide deformylase [Candidatus Omnitrophica bacterium]|nr:peptide deformylase [Candidatus Omnitrophota bacterium]
MPPTVLEIKTLGEGVLRKAARRVDEVTPNDRNLLSRMAQTMYESSGIGLAAPQVGVSKAMIVADIGSGLYKLVNPKVVRKEGKQVLEEGCLSIPGICVKVKRARRVWVAALDEQGEPVTVEAGDLFACVLQHEIDHLSGKLIVDYASFFQRARIKRQIKQIPGGTANICKVRL